MPQYGRHIYVRPSQGSNPRSPDQTAEALTTEPWRQICYKHIEDVHEEI